MKRRLYKRYRSRRAMGRIPGPTGKYIEVLLALSPYLIDALVALQRRYRRHLPIKSESWRKFLVGRLPGNGRQSK